jgi:hypothetical protein
VSRFIVDFPSPAWTTAGDYGVVADGSSRGGRGRDVRLEAETIGPTIIEISTTVARIG